MKRFGILLPIAAALLLLAASCSLDQFGNALNSMGTNILGPAPVDASDISAIADNVGTTDGPVVEEDGSFVISTGNKDIRIEGIKLAEAESVLADMSPSDIAKIGQKLERDGAEEAIFNEMDSIIEVVPSEDGEPTLVDGLHGTAMILSSAIDFAEEALNKLSGDNASIVDAVRSIQTGLESLSSSTEPKRGDVILLQMTQSLVYDILDVVTDETGALLPEFNDSMFEGDALQSVIDSAGVLIGFSNALQKETGETAGDQSLINGVNDLWGFVEKMIDQMGGSGENQDPSGSEETPSQPEGGESEGGETV